MPAAPAIVAMVISAAGAIYSAYEQKQAAKDEENLRKYNADMMDVEAKETAAQAQREANEQRREGQRVLARQRALYAASGVVSSTGSPLLVQSEQAVQNELAALDTERQGEMASNKLKADAETERWIGRKNRKAANRAFGVAAITGIGSTTANSIGEANKYKKDSPKTPGASGNTSYALNTNSATMKNYGGNA